MIYDRKMDERVIKVLKNIFMRLYKILSVVLCCIFIFWFFNVKEVIFCEYKWSLRYLL